jgi:hypothetical protein
MLLGLVLVVPATAELQVHARRLPAFRKRHDVVELQEPALGTAASCADECALSAITPPDFASNGCRDMT